MLLKMEMLTLQEGRVIIEALDGFREDSSSETPSRNGGVRVNY